MSDGRPSSPEVLIVGGGIAGLALAGFLERAGLEPTVVERTDAFERTGWGIGLWGNGIAVLEALGVAERAVERGTAPGSFVVRAAGGERLADVDIPADDAFLAIHRADLHGALLDAVPDESIRMGTTAASIERERRGVRVELSDGSAHRFDAVVGADGIDSSVREACFAGWSVEDRGTAVWSFWLPADGDVEPPAATTSVWGSGAEAFVGDVGGRVLVNLATRMAPEETPAPPALDRLEAAAGALGWRLPDFVAAIDEPTDVFFDRNRAVQAERWHDGRVALVGDAAHAIHPISGMGAALALEDAYVLADELSGGGDVETALRRFEERRRDRVERVRRAARFEAKVTFTESALVGSLRDALVRRTPAMEWFLKRHVSAATDDPLSTV